MKLKHIILALMLAPVIGLQAQSVRAADKPPAAAEPAARIFDPALATPPAAAMFGLKDKRMVLIDVRPATRFEQYHIPGSLNISLHAIRSKAYLKSKPVVLVNEGFVIAPLAHACQALNKAGFKATILAGGLVAWKHKGGRLIGDPFAQNQVNRVSPRIFGQEKASGGLLIVDASAPAYPGFRQLTPTARHLPLLENREAVRTLKKIIKTTGKDPFARLIVITSTGQENDRIQRRLARDGIHEAFFLEGGLQAYEMHLQYIRMARRPAAERKITTGGCKRCVQDN
jgi:rhodanese-related sulfurtransferase